MQVPHDCLALHSPHMILKGSDAFFQEVGADLLILHHTRDLQLHDAIGHRHQFGWEDRAALSTGTSHSSHVHTHMLPTIVRPMLCFSPDAPSLPCLQATITLHTTHYTHHTTQCTCLCVPGLHLQNDGRLGNQTWLCGKKHTHPLAHTTPPSTVTTEKRKPHS